MKRKIPFSKKVQFVLKHLAEESEFIIGNYPSPIASRLINEARVFLGYSSRTVNADIWSSLTKARDALHGDWRWVREPI